MNTFNRVFRSLGITLFIKFFESFQSPHEGLVDDIMKEQYKYRNNWYYYKKKSAENAIRIATKAFNENIIKEILEKCKNTKSKRVSSEIIEKAKILYEQY